MKGVLPAQNASYHFFPTPAAATDAAAPAKSVSFISTLVYFAVFFTNLVRNTYHIAPVRQIDE